MLSQLPPALDAHIQRHVEAHPNGLSEHALLTLLKRDGGIFAEEFWGHSLDLFKVHFLLMNALYRWQTKLLKSGWWLAVNTTRIALCREVPTEIGDVPAQHSEAIMRDYYLDLNNLQLEARDLEAWLASFWSRYLAQEDVVQALALLELEPRASWEEIKTQHRRLALKHHPDRGGDASSCAEINEAFQTLRTALAP